MKIAKRTTSCLLLACCVLLGCASPTSQGPTTNGSSADCQPGGPCSTPREVKVVIVTMFERGEDSGDAPGELQFWKERRSLDERIPFPQGFHDLWFDESTGTLALLTGVGTHRSASSTMALGLDQRFDLSKAYWLVAGIAGIDPEDASIGSAAWSSWLVDGDLGHEIDAREKPDDWDTGFFARRTRKPWDPNRPEPRGEAFQTNVGLRNWAFELTRDLELQDSPELAKARSEYTAHENALRPPFVLTGGHIAAMTFWHGALLNDWANKWVDYWSGGDTNFVTSGMEDTGTFQAIEFLHDTGRVDRNRFLVLRAGSNYTTPPPGVTAADNLLRENDGYSGMTAALESLYLVGSTVIDELLANWDGYAEQIPGT